MPGPAAVNSSLPTLKPPQTGASCRTSRRASSAVGTSSAARMGLRMGAFNQNGAGATRRDCLFDFRPGLL